MGKPEPHQPPVRTAAGYLRRSTDRQEQSLEDQRGAVEIYARKEGFRVVEWFVDDAVSGTSAEGRKAFQAMIQTSQKRDCPFRYVLVYDVKRFGRVDTDEAGYYRHLLRRAGVEVVYTSEGFNGGDSDDLIRSVKQWQARAESKDLSKVTIRGQLSVVDKGYWGGGVPPFGYDLLYEDPAGQPIRRIRFAIDGTKEEYDPAGKLLRVHPRGTRLARPKTDRPRLVLSASERVKLIQRIFAMYVDEDLGYHAIAHLLNREGISSPRNGASDANGAGWGIGSIRSILLNGTYTGDTHWNRRSFGKFHRISGRQASERPRHSLDKPTWNPVEDWIVIRNSHPSITTQGTFDKVLERHKSPHRGKRSRPYPYLLSGLLRCLCGHAFNGYATNKGRKRESDKSVRTTYYVCSGYVSKGPTQCSRCLLPKDELESLIWEKVKSRVALLLSEPLVKDLEPEARARLERIEAVHTRGSLGERRAFLRSMIKRIGISPEKRHATILWSGCPGVGPRS